MCRDLGHCRCEGLRDEQRRSVGQRQWSETLPFACPGSCRNASTAPFRALQETGCTDGNFLLNDLASPLGATISSASERMHASSHHEAIIFRGWLVEADSRHLLERLLSERLACLEGTRL